MTDTKTLFSPEAWQELKEKLSLLEIVCCPQADSIKPFFCFKDQSDFSGEDFLKTGRCLNPLYPEELCELWDDRKTLGMLDIDYIVVDGKKWFYNTYDKLGQFFSQDGTSKVEIELPYWMEMGKVIKIPGVRSAVFDVLRLCKDGQFPEEKEAQKCFSDKLCQKIYNRCPPREAIEMAVLEMMEVFRNKTDEYLRKNHSTDILSEPTFKKYVLSRTFPENTPDVQKVREFLSSQKHSLYFLAEKFGLIKNGTRIFHYEDIRNHVRHPDQVKEHLIKPNKVYEDFCLALKVSPQKSSKTSGLMQIGDNIDISLHLSSLSFVWNILDFYVDPNLKKKKNKECYYLDLIAKGILEKDEADTLRSLRLTFNDVAHVNNNIENARRKVMEDRKIFNLVSVLAERHRLLQKE